MQVDWAAWMAQSDNYEGMVCLFADGYLSEEHLPYIVKCPIGRDLYKMWTLLSERGRNLHAAFQILPEAKQARRHEVAQSHLIPQRVFPLLRKKINWI